MAAATHLWSREMVLATTLTQRLTRSRRRLVAAGAGTILRRRRLISPLPGYAANHRPSVKAKASASPPRNMITIPAPAARRAPTQGLTTKKRTAAPALQDATVATAAPQHAVPPPACSWSAQGSTLQKRPAPAAPSDDPAPKRVAFAAPPADPMDPRLSVFYKSYGFEAQCLPPPPHGVLRDGASGDHEVPNDGDHSVPNDGDHDVSSNHSDDNGDHAQHDGPDFQAHDRVKVVLPQRGRFSSFQQEAFQRCFAELDESIAACAVATNLPQNHVLNAYVRQTEGLKARGENLWNLYQPFANSTPALRLAERRRVDPHYTPPFGEDTPALDTMLLAQAFTAFKQKYTQEQAEDILTTSAELVKNESEVDQNLRQRQIKFQGWKGKFTGTLNKMSTQDNFEAFMVLNGVWLNEDTELGAVITTPGMKTFLEDIHSCESDIIAAAKLTAYMNSMKNVQIANVPAANISAAATSAAVTTATSDAEDASTADFAPDTSVPARAKPKAKPSSVKNEKQKATNNKHQNDIKASRLRLATACINDTGVDIFMKDNSNFTCATVANLLATAELACTGWPADVRLFSWYPGGKGTSAWRDPEMVLLNAALDARKGGPEQGLRFERRKHLSGSYVIFSHDYCVSPLAGPATAIKQHWRTSGGELLPCLRDDNASREVDYDLRHTNPVISIGSPLTANTSKGYAVRSKAKHKPAKHTKGKRKAKQDSDSGSSDFEPEEEEPASPPLKRQWGDSTRPSDAPSAEAPGATMPEQEGGRCLAPRRTTQCTAAPAAPATAAPAPLFMSDDEKSDDVPIRRTARRRVITVRSESESESAAEAPIVPQVALSPQQQVMDYVEIPVSPVHKSKRDGRETRNVFDGAGRLLGKVAQHGASTAYQWDVPPPRTPPHEWDPPLPTSAPPPLRSRRLNAARQQMGVLPLLPPASSSLQRPPPPPAAPSSASLQRPPPLPPVAPLLPAASSSALRQKPPPPPPASLGPPPQSMAPPSVPPSRSGFGTGRERPQYSTPPITTLSEAEVPRRTHAPLCAPKAPDAHAAPASSSMMPSSSSSAVRVTTAPDALAGPVSLSIAPMAGPMDLQLLQLLGLLKPEQISAMIPGFMQGGAPP
ncbi:hypothetical protein DFH08DRAFT_960506 [Mycena albidolilacea]|uniref:Uncharacterized protein n=1 Tax=Mycena albidolilacea TaxID=1033008 RepID=A0AAD7ERM6_9AGAR|nr:hypothetical protein DFH08DRAFT_960506 [Mycena albidolilacea]